MISFLKGYLEVPEDEAAKSYEFLVSHMPDNVIVDDAVIRQAMEFAALALKLKPDAVPDISKVATGRTPARRQSKIERGQQKLLVLKTPPRTVILSSRAEREILRF